MIALAATIVAFLALSPGLFAKDLYFIFSGPVDVTPGTPKVPHETRIYRFDENSRILEQVWTLGKHREAQKVGVYTNPGTVVIADETEICIVPMNNAENSIAIRQDGIIGFHYFEIPNDLDLIEIRLLTRGKDGTPVFSRAVYSTDGFPSSSQIKSPGFPGIIRLSGPRPNGIREHDIIPIGNIDRGDIGTKNTKDLFSFEPIPDSVIQQGTTAGWVLIANEPSYLALCARPDRTDASFRELLIYNRNNRKWSSILMEGSSTSAKLVNGWLVGRVMDVNPGSDMESRKLLSPIIKEREVFINPEEGRYFVVPLDFNSDILWIEGDIVYYKSGEDLLKARIEKETITDEKILASDPVVKYFCFAFRERASDKDGIPPKP